MQAGGSDDLGGGGLRMWGVQARERASALWMWGRGKEGQLGQGSLEDCALPCLVPALKARAVLQVRSSLTVPCAVLFGGLPGLLQCQDSVWQCAEPGRHVQPCEPEGHAAA